MNQQEITQQIDNAKKQLREFGFAPITPAIYAGLMEDGEFDNDSILTDKRCGACGNYLTFEEAENGDTCATCNWFAII